MYKNIYEKLKNLTTPDRIIDSEIEVLIRGKDWVITKPGCVMGLNEGNRYNTMAGFYTSSIDAALTIVDMLMPEFNMTVNINSKCIPITILKELFAILSNQPEIIKIQRNF